MYELGAPLLGTKLRRIISGDFFVVFYIPDMFLGPSLVSGPLVVN